MITTRTAKIFLDDTGILWITVFECVTIDLEDAVDNFLVVKQLSGGQPRLKLWDTRVNWKITKDRVSIYCREMFRKKPLRVLCLCGR